MRCMLRRMRPVPSPSRRPACHLPAFSRQHAPSAPKRRALRMYVFVRARWASSVRVDVFDSDLKMFETCVGSRYKLHTACTVAQDLIGPRTVCCGVYCVPCRRSVRLNPCLSPFHGDYFNTNIVIFDYDHNVETLGLGQLFTSPQEEL